MPTGSSPPARLLDLTRLVSRAGRMPTGIDRVERAYAVALAAEPAPLFGLVRTAAGYLLLDGAGVGAVVAATDSGDWGRPDALSRLSLRLDPARQAGQSFARARAVARSLHGGLGRMLRRHLPPGTACLNIGHSNLTEASLAALRAVPGARVAVMIHDTIPLDYPGYQRPGTVESFAARLRAAAGADLILTPSEVSRRDVQRNLGAGCPTVVAAPLGVRKVAADPGALPPGLPPEGPYFVALGTIEPRKNHALLLDAWEAMGPAAPSLVICGSRGWNNAEVFARLDAAPPRVIEVSGLPDAGVAALLAGARALLFPSLAEGYGLPLVEAAAQGTPVICSDLPICREVLGDAAVYLPPTDGYLWQKTIEALTAQPQASPPVHEAILPTWEDHFKIVLRLT